MGLEHKQLILAPFKDPGHPAQVLHEERKQRAEIPMQDPPRVRTQHSCTFHSEISAQVHRPPLQKTWSLL